MFVLSAAAVGGSSKEYDCDCDCDYASWILCDVLGESNVRAARTWCLFGIICSVPWRIRMELNFYFSYFRWEDWEIVLDYGDL